LAAESQQLVARAMLMVKMNARIPGDATAPVNGGEEPTGEPAEPPSGPDGDDS
jgi:hypothetical protein